MSLFQALVLALLQGVTELFPVSSLGHTVILPKLLGWNINQADPTFLAFVAGRSRAGLVPAQGGGAWWKRRELREYFPTVSLPATR